MEDKDWSDVKFFSSTDNWGDPSRISKELVLELDKFRAHIGTPVFISCGTQGTHIQGSYHYQGLAVDIIFPKHLKTRIPEYAIEALKFKFTGIGAYNTWRYKDRDTGGLHLDIRPAHMKSTWIGLGKNVYIGFSFENFKKHF